MAEECYICKDITIEELIKPCNCKYVHQTCIRDWINRTSNIHHKTQCELCNEHYKIKHKKIIDWKTIKFKIIIVKLWIIFLLIEFILPIGIRKQEYQEMFINKSGIAIWIYVIIWCGWFIMTLCEIVIIKYLFYPKMKNLIERMLQNRNEQLAHIYVVSILIIYNLIKYMSCNIFGTILYNAWTTNKKDWYPSFDAYRIGLTQSYAILGELIILFLIVKIIINKIKECYQWFCNGYQDTEMTVLNVV